MVVPVLGCRYAASVTPGVVRNRAWYSSITLCSVGAGHSGNSMLTGLWYFGIAHSSITSIPRFSSARIAHIFAFALFSALYRGGGGTLGMAPKNLVLRPIFA